MISFYISSLLYTNLRYPCISSNYRDLHKSFWIWPLLVNQQRKYCVNSPLYCEFNISSTIHHYLRKQSPDNSDKVSPLESLQCHVLLPSPPLRFQILSLDDFSVRVASLGSWTMESTGVSFKAAIFISSNMSFFSKNIFWIDGFGLWHFTSVFRSWLCCCCPFSQIFCFSR